jgi:hypothetical protein
MRLPKVQMKRIEKAFHVMGLRLSGQIGRRKLWKAGEFAPSGIERMRTGAADKSRGHRRDVPL